MSEEAFNVGGVRVTLGLGASAPGGQLGPLQITTEEVQSITETSALLVMTVDTGGRAATVWWVITGEFGGGQQGVTVGTTALEAGHFGTQTVTFPATGLQDEETYLVQAFGTSGTQALVFGLQVSFETLAGAGSEASVVTDQTSLITATTAQFNATINPDGLDGTFVFRYRNRGSSTDLFTDAQSCGSASVPDQFSAAVAGLVIGSQYKVWTILFTAQHPDGLESGNFDVFTTIANGDAPKVENVDVTVTTTSFNIKFDMTAGSSAATVFVRWGEDQGGPYTHTEQLGVFEASDDPVSINCFVEGLAADTTYYAEIFAGNEWGEASSPELEITTDDGIIDPPKVVTMTPQSVGTNSVVLRSSCNPNGSDTEVFFWVARTVNGLSNPAVRFETAHQQLGNGMLFIEFIQSVINLLPDLTYYFVPVAISAGGVSFGAVSSFTTQPASLPPDPTISNVEALNVTAHGALLSATFTGHNTAALVFFEVDEEPADWTGTGYQQLPPGGQQITIISPGDPQNYQIPVTGLEAATEYELRFTVDDPSGNVVEYAVNFTTEPEEVLPTVTTLPATNILSTTMQLNAIVNSHGESGVTMFWKYGLAVPLGTATASQNVPADLLDHAFGGNIITLTPGETYLFQAVGEKGTNFVFGDIRQATTRAFLPPTAVTTSAAVVNANSTVLLAGTIELSDIDPLAPSTFFYFQWGDANYSGAGSGQSPTVLLGNQPGTVGVSFTTGALPNGSYHYRLVAFNSAGTVNGDDETFIVNAAPSQVANSTILDAGTITPYSMMLAAQITPNGSAGTFVFEYANNSNFTGSTFTDPIDFPDRATWQVCELIVDLTPQQAVYVRGEATNSAGVQASSNVKVFGTLVEVIANAPQIVSVTSDKTHSYIVAKRKYKSDGRRTWAYAEIATDALMSTILERTEITSIYSTTATGDIQTDARFYNLNDDTDYWIRWKLWNTNGFVFTSPLPIRTDPLSWWSADWAASVGTRIPADGKNLFIPRDMRTGLGTITEADPLDMGPTDYVAGPMDAYSIVVTPTSIKIRGGTPVLHNDQLGQSNVVYAMNNAYIGDIIWVDEASGFVYEQARIGYGSASESQYKHARWATANRRMPVTGLRVKPMVSGTEVVMWNPSAGSTNGSMNGVYFQGFRFLATQGAKNAWSITGDGGVGSSGVGRIGLYNVVFISDGNTGISGHGFEWGFRLQGGANIDFRDIDCYPPHEHFIYGDALGEHSGQQQFILRCRIVGLSPGNATNLPKDSCGRSFVQVVARAGTIMPNGQGNAPSGLPRGDLLIKDCEAKTGAGGGAQAFSIWAWGAGTVTIQDCTYLGQSAVTGVDGYDEGVFLANGDEGKGVIRNKRGFSVGHVVIDNISIAINQSRDRHFVIKDCELVEFVNGFDIQSNAVPAFYISGDNGASEDPGVLRVTPQGSLELFGYVGWNGLVFAKQFQYFGNNNPYTQADYSEFMLGKQFKAYH